MSMTGVDQEVAQTEIIRLSTVSGLVGELEEQIAGLEEITEKSHLNLFGPRPPSPVSEDEKKIREAQGAVEIIRHHLLTLQKRIVLIHRCCEEIDSVMS